MGIISSTMKIVDGGTSTIQKNIDIMIKMVDVMEQMNRAGDMPGLEDTFNDIRNDISLANHELDEFKQHLNESGEEGQKSAYKSRRR